jgi:hypothetical protein
VHCCTLDAVRDRIAWLLCPQWARKRLGTVTCGGALAIYSTDLAICITRQCLQPDSACKERSGARRAGMGSGTSKPVVSQAALDALRLQASMLFPILLCRALPGQLTLLGLYERGKLLFSRDA